MNTAAIIVRGCPWQCFDTHTTTQYVEALPVLWLVDVTTGEPLGQHLLRDWP